MNDLYSAPNVVRVIKSRRMRASTRFKWGILRKRDHMADPGINGRMVLRWIFRK
jgi:hypothetical protein